MPADKALIPWASAISRCRSLHLR